MNFNEIISISKLGGLYQIHKKRNDGLIVKSLLDEKVVFVASRSHSFTPLENITIYTQTDSIELYEVFKTIATYQKSHSLPSAKAENSVLKEFFTKIVPQFDEEKVYISDIQKIIKWFILLDSKGISWSAKNTTNAEEPIETPAIEEVVEKKAKKTAKKTAKLEDASANAIHTEKKPKTTKPKK